MSEEEITKAYYNLLEDKELLEDHLLDAKITRERYRLLAKKYKEVIEEVREVINGYIPNEEAMCKVLNKIEFILDKAKENK